VRAPYATGQNGGVNAEQSEVKDGSRQAAAAAPEHAVALGLDVAVYLP
jgi:hypothetical protein